MIKEIEILRALEHENISKLIELYETNSHIYIVLEHLQGEELHQKIADNEFLEEKDCFIIFK